MNTTSNDNSNDQKSNATNDQKPSLIKQSNDECVSSQNAKDSNASFRPLNMFNSPPPGFIRPPPGPPPPLLNPNFFPPPNRFWGNAPPGMNTNHNKAMQQPNRWSSPPNFDRQRFNRPPPDFGMESRTNNRRGNNDEDEDGGDNGRDDEHSSKDDDNAGEDLDNFDNSPVNESNDGEANQSEQSSSNPNNSAPKRQNPFSQLPRIPANEDGDFNSPNKPNNIGRPVAGMQPTDGGPANSLQSPAFNRNNNNPNQQFNNQNFNNPIGPFNQTPQPLFAPQNMNFNSPMRGGRGGIRNDSPYFRLPSRGRGGPPGMNMNRGNFRPNFRGNNNRGNW